MKLNDGQSLIQKTLLRAAKINNSTNEIVTICNGNVHFKIQSEYQKLAINNVLKSFVLEPCPRNTSAAIALASHYIKDKYSENSIIVILSADQLMDDGNEFQKSIDQAIKLALDNYIVTLGIQPSHPATNYGYIKAKGHSVIEFTEKPQLELAQQYYNSGKYLWNAGIFISSIKTIQTEINKFTPDIFTKTKQSIINSEQRETKDFSCTKIRLDDYSDIENISIDYSVLEKSSKIAVVKSNTSWTDIGSWQEYGKLSSSDNDANHISGDKILTQDVNNCIIHSDKKLIAGLGLNDLIIADTEDALLVAHKDRDQDIREIYNLVKSIGDKSFQEFPESIYEWGTKKSILKTNSLEILSYEINEKSTVEFINDTVHAINILVINGTIKIISDESSDTELKSNEHKFLGNLDSFSLNNTSTSQTKLLVIKIIHTY